MRILRIVGSQALPCGCFAGLYELFSGQTVRIVDLRGDECCATAHRVGAVLGEAAGHQPPHEDPEVLKHHAA